MSKLKVIRANEGSQEDFVSCPYYECLYHGTRGPGKTYALLLAFYSYFKLNLGNKYRGIIFRRTAKELREVELKANELFRQLYGTKLFYKRSTKEFFFPNGECLGLAHAEKTEDYWDFHGHEYGFMGFDELTNWTNLDLYERLKSLCRLKPTIIRATTNSLGPGHNEIKQYFKLSELPFGSVITDKTGLKRTNIWGSIVENPFLSENETYMNFLKSIKDPNVKKSWLGGSWDIVAGGALSDVFRTDIHILKPFKIPNSWSIYRNLDWGSAKPYCVLYLAESDGSDYIDHKGKKRQTLKGDIFYISEIYGWGGKPNSGTKETPTRVKLKMIEREKLLKKYHSVNKIYAGVADSAIYAHTRGEDESSIADLFKPLTFQPSIKGKGSRMTALDLVREKLSGSIPDKLGFREDSGMFFFDTLEHTLRTIPTLPRDPNNVEDVDTKSEDHAYDCIKDYVQTKRSKTFVFRV